MTDKQALERYRYMIKTAPPEAIEQAHAEAFGRLTPEQRQQVLAELAHAAPPGERAGIEATSPDDTRAMGRVATRTEMRQPGFMERTFGGGGGGMMGGLGGSLLGSFAMGFAGSMIAHSFFSAMDGVGDGGDAAADADVGGEPAAEVDQTEGDMTADADTLDTGGDMGDIGDLGGGGDFDV